MASLTPEPTRGPSRTPSPANSSIFGGPPRVGAIYKQLEAISTEAIQAASDDPAKLPKIVIPRGKNKGNYVLDSWLKRHQKPRTSWVHEHGYILALLLSNKKTSIFWACKICDRGKEGEYTVYGLSSSTAPAVAHLRQKHSLDQSGLIRKAGQPTLQESIKIPHGNPRVTQSLAEKFRSLLLRFILANNLPFTIVKNQEFRDLYGYFDPEQFDVVCPNSHSTVGAWMEDEYDKQQLVVKKEMETSIAKIHLSFDIWTSPTIEAYLSKVAYFVNPSHKRVIRHLAMKRIYGAHSGDTQARVMGQIGRQFGYWEPSRVGYFVADNAENCDTSVRSSLTDLYSENLFADIPTLEKTYRGRCIGHILNIAAKSFFEGDELPDFPNDADDARELELIKQWRKRGPIGKLHNIVHWVTRSPKRRDRFHEISQGKQFNRQEAEAAVGPLFDDDFKGLRLKRDNDTRWNSTLEMIIRALQMRRVIDLFCRYAAGEEDKEIAVPKEDILSEEDWQVLIQLLGILHPLFRLTKRFEGNTFLRFHEIIPSLYKLQERFQELLSQYEDGNNIPGNARLRRLAWQEEDDPTQDSITVATVTVTAPEPALELAPESTRGRRSRRSRRVIDYRVDLPSRKDISSRSSAAPTLTPPTNNLPTNDPVFEEFNDTTTVNPRLHLSAISKATIRRSIQFAMDKISKYQNLLDESMVPWFATILHPAYKSTLLTKYLPTRALQFDAAFRQHLEEHYPVLEHSPQPQVDPMVIDADLQVSDNWLAPDLSAPDAPPRNEITEYLAEPCLPLKGFPEDEGLLKWWAGRETQYPRLYRMAIDLLTIPAMSSENERGFSQGRLMITSQRHSLSSKTINILHCMKQWLRAGVFNAWEMGRST